MVTFVLDGETVRVDADDPSMTALDLIRTRLRRTGTKEGCAEGDCGACTVLLGQLDGESVRWRAVNACILFVPMLHGKALMTVESLGGTHPVQRAMAEGHGSQCGFCTPGFVMSLVGRSMGALGSGAPVADVIAGNLCRCTGYGPILAAGEAAPIEARDERATARLLRDIGPAAGSGWFAPRTADELASLLRAYPDARIVAGATDVGLWVTKALRDLGTVIFIGDVVDLRGIAEDRDGVTLGACVRYSEALPALARLHPDLGELVRRIGGLQVRNAGTIGGNIANGSPIGDMPPALIALGATLTLRQGDTRRTLPLEAFFLAYGKQDRHAGEFVESVHIPRPAPEDSIAITKISKRFDSDISAVCGAFALRIEAGVVTGARIAFGGMAGIPMRARACEASLIGKAWSEATVEAAADAMARDYQPLTDLRASSDYRLSVAGNLLRRLWIESETPAEGTRVLAHG